MRRATGGTPRSSNRFPTLGADFIFARMGETAINRRYPALSLSRLQARSRPSDYTLEQRVQKQYKALLFDGLQDLYGLPAPEALDYVLETAFPQYFNGSQQERCQQYWQADERVQHDVPEVIRRLPRAELEQLAALLAAQDLIGVIRLVWFTFRPALHKLASPEKLPDDRKQHAAAGLGKRPVHQANKRSYQPSEVTPSLPEPSPAAVCCARCRESSPHASLERALPLTGSLPAAPSRVTRKPAAPQTPVVPAAHLWRVKRAQERKRLKRKRR